MIPFFKIVELNDEDFEDETDSVDNEIAKSFYLTQCSHKFDELIVKS